MGLGEFLSTRSEQARWNRERDVEVHEIEHNPEQEYDETVHLLEDTGLSPDDAKTVADIYRRYPGLWADWMMRHELEMEDMSGATPAKDGMVTFLSFLVFGVIPLVPYSGVLGPGHRREHAVYHGVWGDRGCAAGAGFRPVGRHTRTSG